MTENEHRVDNTEVSDVGELHCITQKLQIKQCNSTKMTVDPVVMMIVYIINYGS